MKKLLLGLIAALCMIAFATPSFALEGEGAAPPAEGTAAPAAKKMKKSHKHHKKSKKADEAGAEGAGGEGTTK